VTVRGEFTRSIQARNAMAGRSSFTADRTGINHDQFAHFRQLHSYFVPHHADASCCRITGSVTPGSALKLKCCSSMSLTGRGSPKICGLHRRFSCNLACLLVFFVWFCLRVCVFACLRVCVFVRLRVCLFVCFHVCLFARLFVCMFVCLRVILFACLRFGAFGDFCCC
jgi:hypothetical protein